MIKESNLKRDKTVLNVHANEFQNVCNKNRTKEEE